MASCLGRKGYPKTTGMRRGLVHTPQPCTIFIANITSTIFAVIISNITIIAITIIFITITCITANIVSVATIITL